MAKTAKFELLQSSTNYKNISSQIMECFITTAEFPIVFTFFTFALLAAKAKQDIREKFVSYERTLIPSTLILLVFVQLHPCLCISGS